MATLNTILNIRVDGTSQMTALKDAIDKTSKELKDLKKNGKDANETQKQFNAQIVTAETKLKGLRGEMNKSKTELIKTAKAVGDTSKSYNSLTKSNASLSIQLRKLSDPLGKNKKQFEQLSKKIRINTNELKKMDAAMGRQQRNVGNYKAAISSVALGVGAAILAFKTLQRVLATFSDFQFQMKQVGVISGATAAELAMLEQQAKKLGATTSFTAGEIAEFQKEIAKLGFDPTAIENMTTSVLDLAFAFGDDLAEAGTQVAIVLNSFQLDASETTRVTDVMAKAFASTPLDLQKFATSFPKVGAIAKQVGFEFEGVVAMLGQLSKSGLDASMVGTSLKNIFLKLADPSGALALTLGRNITSIDQLVPALKELEMSGVDVAGMLELTDQRSVTAFANLLSGADDVAKLNNELKNAAGTTKTFAEVMRESMKGSLDETTSAAQAFVIELVERLEPTILLVLDGMKLMFGLLGGLVNNFGKVAFGVGVYGGILAISTISQLGFVGALTSTKIGLGIYNLYIKIAAINTKSFNFAIASNPIGILITALAIGAAFLIEWGLATGGAGDETEDLNEELVEEIKNVNTLASIKKRNRNQEIKEIAQLKQLTKAIKDKTLATEHRERALVRFNELAGTNISNLQDEKTILIDLEKAYSRAVDSIKRKIILQATEEQVIELLTRQLDIEVQLAAAQEVVTGATERNAASLTGLNDAQKLAIESGIELEDVVGGWTMPDFENWGDDYMGAHQAQLDLTEQLNQARRDEGDEIQLTTDIISGAKTERVNALNELETATRVLTGFESENASISDQITAIYAKQSNVLDGLSAATNRKSFSTAQSKTEYQKLKDEIKLYNDELIKEIINGEIAVARFLATEDAKAMSVEDRNTRVAAIETDTAAKVEAATNTLIDAKTDLKDIETEIGKAYEVINSAMTSNVEKMKDVKKAGEKVIAMDKDQLQLLADLEKAGANVAEERIKLALKVARSELSLALKTMAISDLTTSAQIRNISRLKQAIEGFQAELDALGAEGGADGFMNKALFGTSEEGGTFTGEDLLNSINATLDATTQILGDFNRLQNERLNTQLGILERTKNDEVKAFEDSAAYQIMTDEERTATIEAIQKRHDDEMLQLKIEQFNKDQALAITQAIIGGAQSVMGILAGQATGNVIADAIIKGVLIAASVGTTLLQIATIKAQAPPTAEFGGVMDDSFFANGGMVNGRSHAQGGEKFGVGGRVVELEGGEAVINKRSTSMFKPMLSQMNVAGGGRKFADGGMVFNTDSMSNDSLLIESLFDQLNNQQVLLVEADVTSSQRSVKNIESRITF